MKNILLTAAFGLSAMALSAQSPDYRQSFDKSPSWQTCAGVEGTALNLDNQVAVRHPVPLTGFSGPYDGSFTAQCWAKAAPDDASYVLLSATGNNEGWELGVQANGAWYWQTVNSRARYTYYPTPQRQSIRDRKWHQLTYSYDAAKKEAALYYDGLQVAIYHVPALPVANMADSLFAGGRPSGDLQEWNTFNGALDEVTLYKSVLSPQQVQASYARYFKAPAAPVMPAGKPLTVMNFNIYHGGNETGKGTGPQRVVDIIRQSGADIVSMQETYGSGEKIADALGYYFYLRSTNLSIMSRYPIAETLNGAKPFCNGGAYIRLNDHQQVAFITNWLNYPLDYWDLLEKKEPLPDTLLAAMDRVNAAQLKENLQAIRQPVADADKIPVIFCGDFNSGSHLDWVESTRHLNGGYVMPFPQSRIMQDAGFKDSYRQLHPDPLKDRGITWSPMLLHAFKDRIDYIYYKGSKLQPLQSFAITTHPVRYPSDHAAMVTVFKIN
ncbi:LamG-like jellyroll fold domain-containing protein [Chitinophaga sp.]|uniref:LamG-like jellyroll fold domain-containing protein n=1 Tax=Chitinophaga sp. TaxID=1869181 RepID=UPI0031D2ABB9